MLTNGKLLAKVMVLRGSLANHNQLLGYFLPGITTTSRELYYLVYLVFMDLLLLLLNNLDHLGRDGLDDTGGQQG
ncbi:hypothetical protein TSAR_011421 [Trichomalopsis sarcophagae]|uniref:Uncharacterized protein n=1 Tax=Trichomalopsis sarcophagae TaxID=543379 RepID=A0A232EDS0_9HYME|nr:hypothetical protein TSAR_011421 [Trichomalopsis sarcophagae]